MISTSIDARIHLEFIGKYIKESSFPPPYPSNLVQLKGNLDNKNGCVTCVPWFHGNEMTNIFLGGNKINIILENTSIYLK